MNSKLKILYLESLKKFAILISEEKEIMEMNGFVKFRDRVCRFSGNWPISGSLTNDKQRKLNRCSTSQYAWQSESKRKRKNVKQRKGRGKTREKL